MNTKHALVLGVTGMVGEPLAMEMLRRGWQVSGACRFSDAGKRADLAAAGVHCVTYDLLKDDPASLPDVDAVFFVVWDPATMTSKDAGYVWAMNYYGVGRVMERYAGMAAIVNGCTVNVYGNSAEAASEQTPCRPTSIYGRSRYAQERLIDYFCWRGGTAGIHVRYAHANRADKGIVFQMAQTILKGKSLGSAPDARMQVIAIEDFVRVTSAALDRVANPPAVVNCCHPRVWTRRELAETIQRRLGTGTVVFDCEQGGETQSAIADVSRMREWFGDPTVPVSAVIERAVKHVRDRAT